MMVGADAMQIVIFRVAGQEFALEISQVERILRWQRPSPVPQAPAFLDGVVSYDDGVVPVVDMRTRLSVEASEGAETRLVVLQLDEQRVAVSVDAVVEVLRIDAREVSAPPALVRGLAAKFIDGILSREDRTVLLLNARRLFTSKEKLALARLEA